MKFKLGANIKVGQQIKTLDGWEKIESVEVGGVVVGSGFIYFGEVVYGWKA